VAEEKRADEGKGPEFPLIALLYMHQQRQNNVQSSHETYYEERINFPVSDLPIPRTGRSPAAHTSAY